MESTSNPQNKVLVVADWKADLPAVVEAIQQWHESHHASFALLVPAWLHGLDWAGDPHASVPCARRALDQISQLAAAAGLPVDSAEVGDRDPVAAITGAVSSQPVDQLIIFLGERRSGVHPLDVARRAERATAIPAVRIAVREANGLRRPRLQTWLGASHCAPADPLAA